MKVNEIMANLEAKHPGENEYLQAVREVLETIEEEYNKHPEFEAAKIVERIVEPDRIFKFRVVWVDDKGQTQVNLGYRVQYMLPSAHTKAVFASTPRSTSPC